MIFGGSPFLLWFLGFDRGGEYRRSANFQLIPASGSAPSFSPFQQQQFYDSFLAAGTQFLVAAISCLSERFLHLP